MFIKRIQVFLDRVIDAEIDDFKSSALEHHGHQVLADVVNVAFYGTDDDFADWLHARFRQQGAQYLHAALHRIRGEQHLRDEQDSVAKIDPDDAHAFDEGVV